MQLLQASDNNSKSDISRKVNVMASQASTRVREGILEYIVVSYDWFMDIG
jgi:hypothetical protein